MDEKSTAPQAQIHFQKLVYNQSLLPLLLSRLRPNFDRTKTMFDFVEQRNLFIYAKRLFFFFLRSSTIESRKLLHVIVFALQPFVCIDFIYFSSRRSVIVQSSSFDSFFPHRIAGILWCCVL